MMYSRFGRRLIMTAGAAAAIVAFALPAAASDPVVVGAVTPLLGTSQTGVHVVTYGQTAAWSVTVTNGGGNTVNHVTLSDAVDVGTVLSTDNAACSVLKGSTTTFTCNVGQMAVGQSFTARFAFAAPLTGATMTNTLNGTFDPQTPNATNNRTTDTLPTVNSQATLIATNAASISTYGLPTVNHGVIHTAALSPTHKQYTEVDLPAALAGGFGTPVQLTEQAGSVCGVCVGYESIIFIPDSESAGANPFTVASPFMWSISVDGSLLPSGFKPQGVYHDGHLLPFCSVTPLSATVPICVSALTQDKKTKTVFATGSATENGTYQFG